ncbi:acetylglutamate kinase [Campylobacter sputorum]|uniref:acetylglutamate kinase n=1 Tax=Campylobacter sputorum TaxID=206 RepID=UPI000B786588|nr:acetylglutamate kinase [Campylobacter sputorum]ASM36702.1 acetylglutamate kinase [Campylobacter sputorum bv. faecalis CCUG 20703]
MHTSIKTAEIILSALPYIQKFRDKIIVVKFGGSTQIKPEFKQEFARDMVLLQIVGIKVVIVHGGGKKINEFLQKTDIKSEFVNGIRKTSLEALEVAEMVLCGNINKELTNLLNFHGAKSIGISGKDLGLFKAKALDMDNLGFVGKITDVNASAINDLLNLGIMPVISPIAAGDENSVNGYNVNADLCACEIAKALHASKVVFLSDISGILDKNQKLISKLNKDDIKRLIDDGTISGGMIPKALSCVECIENGVEKAHIINGKITHSILLELFTDVGIGSMIG